MKSKIILFLSILTTITSFSQTKVGTVDSKYIISLMPEKEIVLKHVRNYGVKLDSTFNVKVSKFKAKVDAFKATEKTLTDSIKKVRIQELNASDQELQKLKQNGNVLMQLKQNELMRPLLKKLNNTIAIVAKENGYTQILTLSGNEFAYIDNKFDITALVLKKLGITVPKTEKK